MLMNEFEQYMLELTNRARLNPLAEANRHGLDHDAVEGGTGPRGILAGNNNLVLSSRGHSEWMLDNDIFSHTGINGSSSQQRMDAAGYNFQTPWRSAENLAFTGTSGTHDIAAAIDEMHANLFLSSGHRRNTLNDNLREVGVGVIQGDYQSYNGSMATLNFASSGGQNFVTGVIYNDRDDNDFYSIGEGQSGVRTSLDAASATTTTAGGYALRAQSSGTQTLSFSSNGTTREVEVVMEGENVKVDLVDGHTFWTTGKLTLGEGAYNAAVLGIENGTLIGNASKNVLTGSVANDRLLGGAGNDTLIGNGGNDRVYAGKGTDKVELGSGKDYVRVGGGKESFDGGSGKDYISYYDSTGGVKINLATNKVSGSWASNDTIKNFESASGSKTGDDIIYGTSGSNTIKTYGGDDRVYAGKGTDKVVLGSGKDYVRVGGGKESFDGGSGKDYISYYDSTGGIRIDLRADRVSGSWASNDTIKNFESASGSKTGADKMYGTSGSNTLKSYGGNDKLYGRSGNDKMYGGDGKDRFDGGAGKDLLFGGAGADTFHFDHGEDRDIIKDFENNIDTIELDNFDFSATVGAGSPFDFARQVGSDVVFDFGGGDMLTVEDTTIGSLYNDLVLV